MASEPLSDKVYIATVKSHVLGTWVIWRAIILLWKRRGWCRNR